MLLTMKWWAYTAVVSLALFAFATVASAAPGDTAQDPSISDFTITSVSSNAKAATGVIVEATFTTTATIPAGVGFAIESNSLDCFDASSDDCQSNIQDAVLTGVSGSTSSSGGVGRHEFTNTSAMPAGTYAITLTGVTWMNYDGGVRLYMRTDASDTSAIESDTTIGTETVVIVGDVLAYGQVNSPAGVGIGTYGEVYNDDWSVHQGFNSDVWGYYAVRNPGFVSGDAVSMTFHPAPESKLFTTTANFTYAGSAVLNNVTLLLPSKNISGTITYADTGEVVANARVNANGVGKWAGENANSSGVYSLDVSGGEYDVCLDSQWDDSKNKPKEVDWYLNDNRCVHVNFANDDSVETEVLNFQVQRADARVTGIFKNPDGTFPENGGWVSFWNNENWFGGQVNSETGAFSVAVVGGNSNSITASSLRTRSVGSTKYQVQYDAWSDDERTYWETTEVTVSADQVKELGIITLAERDVTATMTVVDGDGAPVEGLYVDAWLSGGGGGWTNGQTGADGVATVYLYEGKWEINPSTWNRSDLLYNGEPYRVEVSSGDSITHQFAVTATTVTVDVTALTPDGLVASDQNGWVNCSSPNSFGGFGGQLQNGVGQFGAIGGTYNCNLSLQSEDYQASGETVVTFVDGVDSALAFGLALRNSTIRVYLKDQDSKLVKNARGWVNAHSPDAGWTDKRIGEEGFVDLRVAAGTYFINTWFEENSGYISSFGPQTGITVKDGQTKQTTLTVFSVSGSLTATVKDSNGNLLPDVWVHCGNWQSVEVAGDFSGGRIIESGAQTGADGVAVVGLVAGEKYECNANARPGSGLIGGDSKKISLKQKDAAIESFTMQSATATISLSASLTSAARIQAAGDITHMWCGAWSEGGSYTWQDAFSSSVDLPVIPGTWHVYCGTELLNNDGGYDYYDTREDKQVNISKDGDNKSVALKLKKSIFTVPKSVSVTFDSTTAQSLVMEDGTKVEIPANAIATEGNITLTADPQLDAVHTDDKPYGFPWNFEVYDSAGSIISGDFNDEVLIQIPFDKSILDEEYKIDPEDLEGSSYDEDTGVWDEFDNGTLNEDDGYYTVSVPHFSTIGMVYNSRSITDPPSKPRLLAAKMIKQTEARLTWRAPKNGTVGKYRVQVRKHKIKKEKSWRKFGTVTKQSKRTVKRKVVKKLVAGTKYQFRVKAQNSAGKSAWTKWKTFTTLE